VPADQVTSKETLKLPKCRACGTMLNGDDPGEPSAAARARMGRGWFQRMFEGREKKERTQAEA
jgi:hypothetical protein